MNKAFNSLKIKLCSLFRPIYQIRNSLTPQSKKIFYYSYIYSHISYAAIFLCLCTSSEISILEKYYPKLIKILYKVNRSSSWSELKQKLQILSVKEIIDKNCSDIATSAINKWLPTPLQQHFKVSSRNNKTLILRNDTVTRTSIYNTICLINNKK